MYIDGWQAQPALAGLACPEAAFGQGAWLADKRRSPAEATTAQPGGNGLSLPVSGAQLRFQVGDRDSVVDPRDGHVHGIAGLRVADASLMPTIPRANLNIPTIMLAEKIADGIRERRHG